MEWYSVHYKKTILLTGYFNFGLRIDLVIILKNCKLKKMESYNDIKWRIFLGKSCITKYRWEIYFREMIFTILSSYTLMDLEECDYKLGGIRNKSDTK